MPSAMRRWGGALWPAALLLLFVGTFRTSGPDAASGASASTCESSLRLDAPALEQCLTLDPNNVELMTDLGDAYRRGHDDRQAETLYRRALTIDARDGDVHLRLGELLLERGDSAAAGVEGAAALAVQPNSLAAQRLIDRAAAAGAAQ
jgi:predicted Zn-dependent protease